MTALGNGNEQPKTGVFEVDLLFPRNETYASSPLMQIVFPAQNLILATGLLPMIYWELWQGNNQTSAGSVSDSIQLDLDNLTASDQTLISSVVYTSAYPGGVWTFTWSVNVNNCTTVEGQPEDAHGAPAFKAKPIVFTVSKSGQAPDLVAVTSADKCDAAESFAFNVSEWGIQCGVLGPSPTTNPCAAKIDPAAASRISAAATDFACSALDRPLHPNITCPSPTSASTGNPGMAVALTLLVLLATLTTLLHLG
ncbi:hypothetical protein MKX08_002796 [Trichoderma sp. CBMAI-0020]|nr:hypothetical protein MKX08_002796 [Trichoderma sp. CBMAI-0020]